MPSNKRRYVSHSSLDTYRQCPEKYRLTYVEGEGRKPMMAGVGGSAVHHATEVIDHEELWRE